jgi:penicillin-binding protein 1A
MTSERQKKRTTAKTKANTKHVSRKKKSVKKKGLKLIVILIVVGFILLSLIFASVFFGFTGHVPTTAQLHEIKNPQASEVFSEDGKLLGRYYVENRSNVSFNEISPNVINALIATEDERFYEHRGIDEIALMRVLFKTILLMDRSSGGGSTISQQVAKNLFPRNDIGIISLPVNKLRESIIAYRMERIYNKEEILTLYLNTVPFAENIFGIEVAAERFFSKKPSDLTVDEAAVLVGMLKANNLYNPRTNPERSKERRNIVIGQMVKNGYLSQEEGDEFIAKPLEIKYRRISYNEGPAPYFLEMIKPELLEWCESNLKENGEPWNLYTDGLAIKTTINYDFQFYATLSVTEHMKNLQEVFDRHWEGSVPWRANEDILRRAVMRSERYTKMTEAGFSAEQIDKAFNQPTETNLFTWDGLKHVETTPLDSVKHYLKFLNAGFLAVEPASGELKAWVGGIDFRFFKYDHVISERQAGSTFKPFVYLAALESGLNPAEYIPNRKMVYPQYDDWSPSNTNGIYEGYYSMEGALAHSVNTIAVEMIMQTGIDNVISTVRDLGIKTDLPRVPSLALGVTTLSLKDLLFAYSTMANGGIRVEPYYLVSISDSQGELLREFNKPGVYRTLLNEDNCRIITAMMETAVNEGTGAKIRSVYRIPGDFAGKTGTTQNQSDGWFVGITPDLVTGCWVGAEDPGIHFRTLTYGQGSYMALPVVGKFYHKLYSDPRYRKMQYNRFPGLNEQLASSLDIPLYREMLEIEREDNILERLFTKKLREEELKDVEKREELKEKKNVWQSIKNIFKKNR